MILITRDLNEIVTIFVKNVFYTLNSDLVYKNMLLNVEWRKKVKTHSDYKPFIS